MHFKHEDESDLIRHAAAGEEHVAGFRHADGESGESMGARAVLGKLVLPVMVATFLAGCQGVPGDVGGASKVVANPNVANTLMHRDDTVSTLEPSGDLKGKPELAPLPAINFPNRIVLSFNGDPTTRIGVNWFTKDDFGDSKVIYGKKKDLSDGVEVPAKKETVELHYAERDKNGAFLYSKVKDGKVLSWFTDAGMKGTWKPEKMLTKEEKADKVEVKVTMRKTNETRNTAILSGLEPDTTYYYKVGSKKGGMSEVGTFRTASKDKDGKFTFLHYTDSQNVFHNEHSRNEAAYAADTLDRMLESFPESLFVLHTGDIVEYAEVEDEWTDLMNRSRNGFMKTTIVPAAGNHDEYGAHYVSLFPEVFNKHFNIPAEGPIDGGSYYSFDVGPAHFTVLNTNDYKNPQNKAVGAEQMAWAKKDIEKAKRNGAQWIILAYHKPLFSKSYHSLQDEDVINVRPEMMKLIDELDVDVALQGHDHVLSRTHALNYAPKSVSFVNAKVAKKTFGDSTKQNGHDWVKNASGTVFVLPNTAGTKTYDDIIDKSLEHIKKVRPKLSYLNQDMLDHYRSLFRFGYQPDKSPAFEKSHSNNRDGAVQNFAVYEVTPKKFNAKIYEIKGELGSSRNMKLVDEFTIEK